MRTVAQRHLDAGMAIEEVADGVETSVPAVENYLKIAGSRAIRRSPQPYTNADELPAALSVACGYCGAPVGRWCTTKSTRQPMRRGQRYHPSRIEQAEAEIRQKGNQ